MNNKIKKQKVNPFILNLHFFQKYFKIIKVIEKSDDLLSTISSQVIRKKVGNYLFKEECPFLIKNGLKLYEAI